MFSISLVSISSQSVIFRLLKIRNKEETRPFSHRMRALTRPLSLGVQTPRKTPTQEERVYQICSAGSSTKSSLWALFSPQYFQWLYFVMQDNAIFLWLCLRMLMVVQPLIRIKAAGAERQKLYYGLK